MGSNGKTIYDIALQLGMTYDELDDERKNNKKLDDALTRAALNEDQKLISDLKGLSLTEKFNSSQKELLFRLLDRHDLNFDNEIKIKEVE